MQSKKTKMLESLDKLPNPEHYAIIELATAMANKLLKTHRQGRGGFQEVGQRHLSLLLQDHLIKGDPVDVANYCAFLHFKEEKIDLPSAEEILADWLK